ncbi:hypothetical protein [Candidatus Leptofilum sp.]|uniref:hypothetical protein n=1 Tax=Candidatus Leptofilum sp. TaxID=3241576 RepID=UPI003B5B50A7
MRLLKSGSIHIEPTSQSTKFALENNTKRPFWGDNFYFSAIVGKVLQSVTLLSHRRGTLPQIIVLLCDEQSLLALQSIGIYLKEQQGD